MSNHESRIDRMYARDKLAAYLCVLCVWLTYLFVYWRMYDHIAAAGLNWAMLALGAIVLWLNTAAVAALIRHYKEDKAAIYGTDVYYLDRIAAEKRAAR